MSSTRILLRATRSLPLPRAGTTTSTRIGTATTKPQRRTGMLVGSCLGLTLGISTNTFSQNRVRFDHPAAAAHFSTSAPLAKEDNNKLNPELMKQLSTGSVAGFLSGLLVSLFSRTLVLLLGASVVLVQVAARYGINIVEQLRLKQKLGNSRVTASLMKDPMFKLSFGLFFALSAFMQF